MYEAKNFKKVVTTAMIRTGIHNILSEITASESHPQLQLVLSETYLNRMKTIKSFFLLK